MVSMVGFVAALGFASWLFAGPASLVATGEWWVVVVLDLIEVSSISEPLSGRGLGKLLEISGSYFAFSGYRGPLKEAEGR